MQVLRNFDLCSRVHPHEAEPALALNAKESVRLEALHSVSTLYAASAGPLALRLFSRAISKAHGHPFATDSWNHAWPSFFQGLGMFVLILEVK